MFVKGIFELFNWLAIDQNMVALNGNPRPQVLANFVQSGEHLADVASGEFTLADTDVKPALHASLFALTASWLIVET